MMLDHRFGEAGATILIEERLSGPEVSVLAFTDGKSVRVTSRRRRTTSGCSTAITAPTREAWAPSPQRLCSTPRPSPSPNATSCSPPCVAWLKKGPPSSACSAHAGLMLTQQGPKVLEFNARFGDPETQVLLPLLQTDLLEILQACVEGKLDQVPVQWGTRGCSDRRDMGSAGLPRRIPHGPRHHGD